jgi:hypothetical protein
MYIRENQNNNKMISNYAVRTILSNYNVKFICKFNLELELSSSKTRNGAVADNYDKFESDLKDLMMNGIPVMIGNEKEYVSMIFVGNSASGVREKNFWAIDKDSFKKIDFQKLIKEFGDFSQIKSIEKLSKRFSQAFSTSKQTIKLKASDYVCVKDVKSSDNSFEFTDGIGCMRPSVAREISECLGFDKFSESINIFQIRCGGFKGILFPN